MSEHEHRPFSEHIPRFPAFIDPLTGQLVPAESSTELPTSRTTVLFEKGGRPSSREISRPDNGNYFISANAPVTPDVLDFFDLDAETKEGNEIVSTWQDLRGALGKQGALKLEKKEYSKFTTLEKRRSDVAAVLERLGDDVPTYGERSVQEVLRLGGSSLYNNLTSRILGMYHDHNSFSADDFFNFDDWSRAGYSSVKFGSITGKEFLDTKPQSKVSTADAFRYLVESYLVTQERRFDEAMQECDSGFFQKYPHVGRHLVAMAGTAVSFLPDIAAHESYFDDATRAGKNKSKAASDVVDLTKKYVTRTDEVAETALQILLDPSSSEFEMLSQEIKGYMAQGRVAELKTMTVLGIQRQVRCVTLYRNARSLASKHAELASFYTDLADAIQDYQTEMPNGAGILTSDDIPTLLIEGSGENTPELCVEDISDAVDQIHPSGYKQNWQIDPQQLNWRSLVTPTDVEISFDRSKYKCFDLTLTYQNAEGESTLVQAAYRFSKGEKAFMINFLEDPSEIPEMYQALMQAAKSILEDVSRQANEKRASLVSTPLSNPNKAISLVKDKLYKNAPRAEEKIKVKNRPVQPVQVLDQDMADEVMTYVPTSKMCIDEVAQKRLEKQLERLSCEDRENVLETIERFNNGESVKFYPLKRKGPHNESLFALRSKATVRGGSRILVTPIEGSSDFAVIAAGYRKDIYRDWGIE